jgi:hypothetical protein
VLSTYLTEGLLKQTLAPIQATYILILYTIALTVSMGSATANAAVARLAVLLLATTWIMLVNGETPSKTEWLFVFYLISGFVASLKEHNKLNEWLQFKSLILVRLL